MRPADDPKERISPANIAAGEIGYDRHVSVMAGVKGLRRLR